MHCFIQLTGTYYPNVKPKKLTIQVGDIRRITKNNVGNAVLTLTSIIPETLHTDHNYDDFIETLSGFQKVEVIEILND